MSAPTADQAAEARAVREELMKAIDEVNRLITTGMPALVKALAGSNALLPTIKPIRPIA
jgi:hypothetical protein